LHIEAYGAQDLKTRIEKYQQILKLYPLDRAANINLGVSYSAIEDWEKALECNETLIRNGVHAILAYSNSIGLCYLPMGMYDRALVLIEHAPERMRKL